jgi:hypothetical protein
MGVHLFYYFCLIYRNCSHVIPNAVIRHPERSEGSPESGSVPITEIPHYVRDDV